MTTPEGDPADRLELRPLLARGLRREGFGAVCRGEPRSSTDLSTRFSWWLTTAITGGVVNSLADWTNATSYGWLGLLALTMAALLVLTLVWSPGVAVSLEVVVWAVFLGVQVAERDHDTWITLG